MPAPEVLPTVPAAPNACPASASGLPDVVERANFCVYYDDSNITDAQADDIADFTQAYWDRYVTGLGFQTPLFTGKLVVEVRDAASCNGATGPGLDYMYVNDECFSSDEQMRKVVGHELFHRVQYSYHGTEVKWFKEGTARAIEDNTFADIDNWPNALSSSSSFNTEANNYLANTNADITSIPMRYRAALWWKYFMEQYGTDPDEPELGVDALLRLWEAAVALDDIAALNSAFSTLGTGTSFDPAFRNFAAANWIKDLTNQPGSAYNYVDEDEPGNPAGYGPIFPTNLGTINAGSPGTSNNQFVSRYGTRYFSATPGASCPVVNATFHTDSGPAFYHVVTQKGTTLDSFKSVSAATDWSQSFFNDGLTRIVAMAGSTNANAQVDVTLQCVTPTINIQMPNSGAVSYVGPFNGPGKFLAQVLVTDGTPKGPVVAGLSVSDFKAKVNGQNALVTGGGFIQEQYWLVIQAPNQGSDGIYDLEISLEQSGTATTIATDTNTASVEYSGNNLDHVLVIDRSGSMGSDDKFVAAKDAAKFYVDITRNADGLAVVPYDHDATPTAFGMSAVTTVPDVRGNAKGYIQGLLLGGATSIGDGLDEAVNRRNASPTGNALCSFVLLSDGMENSSKFWTDVQADVVNTGCPVTAIAFGASSDETLMQNIATATGGLYLYNDVFVSSAVSAAGVDAVSAAGDTNLDLGGSYEYAASDSEGRQRLFTEKGVVPIFQSEFELPADQVHDVLIDSSVNEVVFSLDWVTPLYSKDLELKLRTPDGDLITMKDRPYTFEDLDSEHLGWRISNPKPGKWQMIVNARSAYVPENIPYQVLVSGRSNLTAHLLMPDRLGSRFLTGNRMPIPVFLTGKGPIPLAKVMAKVTAPDGLVTMVPLFDDGEHDDGQPNDGFYNGLYTKVNKAEPSPITEKGREPTEPKDEGSYRVQILVNGEMDGDNFQREALGSFSVQEGPDTNVNDIPDTFEKEAGQDVDSADSDLDQLDLASEYQIGTDANNSDSDGGGENDGSEYFQGKDPLDPSDDEVEAPDYLKVEANVGFNNISYHVRNGYDRLILYRATSPDGPWELRQPELPKDGHYKDDAENGKTYFYRYLAIDGDNNGTEIIGSTPATPSEDPFPPEAKILIDNGAPTTTDLDVALSFAEYEEPEPGDPNTFDDITEMKLSNAADLDGASWQPFQQNIPWTLPPTDVGDQAQVYGMFKDGAGNESLIVTSAILVDEEAEHTNAIHLLAAGCRPVKPQTVVARQKSGNLKIPGFLSCEI